jgi:hypothetical protein
MTEERVQQLQHANDALQRRADALMVEIRNADAGRDLARQRLERVEAELSSARAAYLAEASLLAEANAALEVLRAQQRLEGERDRGTGRLLAEAYRRGYQDASEAARKAAKALADQFTVPAPGSRTQAACTCIRTEQLPDHRPSNTACNLTRHHRTLEGRAMV